MRAIFSSLEGPVLQEVPRPSPGEGEVLVRVYDSQTRRGVDVPPDGALDFGPHPLGRILAGLDVAPQPLLTLHSPYFQLISDEKKLEVVRP